MSDKLPSRATSSAKGSLQVFIHTLQPFGGQEGATLNVLSRLAQRGWEIEVCAFEVSGWPTAMPLKVTRIPGAWLPSQGLRATWYLFVSALCSRRKGSPQRSRLRLAVGACAWAAEVRVIHFFSPAFRRQVLSGTSALPNARTLFHRCYQKWTLYWFEWLERRLLPRSQFCIAVSNRTAREVQKELGLPNVTVIPNGCDSLPWRPLSKVPAAGSPLILFVGAMERKGLAKALRILARVPDLPWRFVALGAGNRAYHVGIARSLGIHTRCEFLGPTPATSYFEKAQVLLFPSTYEPFGMVIPEAVAKGCLPLASRECGALELWPSRPEWLDLSAQESDERWEQALRRVLTEQQERERLVQVAQAELGAWTWDRVASLWEEKLLELLPSSFAQGEGLPDSGDTVGMRRCR